MERTAVAGQGKVQNIARSRLGCVARYHRSMTEDSGWSVIPSIRVPDMQTALEFYTGVLGFTLDRSEPTGDNSSLHRGSARIMLELPSNHFSDAYNQASENAWGASPRRPCTSKRPTSRCCTSAYAMHVSPSSTHWHTGRGSNTSSRSRTTSVTG